MNGKFIRSLKKKIAIATNTVLVLQLVFFGAIIAPQKAEAASGQTVIQPSVQDARVEQLSGNGYNTTLLEVRSAENDNDRSYVQFDLTSAVPEGVTLESANLMLYMQTAPNVASRTYGVHKINESWDEDTIDWTTQPSSEDLPTDVTGTGTTDGVWLSWDISTDVISELSGGESFGWMIKDQSEDSPAARTAQLRPKNYTDVPTLQPKLVVDYSSKPVSNIITPLENTFYNGIEGNDNEWPGVISGTSQTPLADIDRVDIAISDGTKYFDWTEETWSATVSDLSAWKESVLDDASNEWSLGYTPNKDGIFTILSRATDTEGGQEGDDIITGVSYDTSSPVLTATVTPGLVNKDTRTVNIEINSTEELKEQDVPVVALDQRVEALRLTYEIKLTINDDPSNPLIVYLSKDAGGKYIYSYVVNITGEKEITLDYEGLDFASNPGSGESKFNLDNIAPGKVTNLSKTTGNGKINLSWTNPTDTDFAGVRIFRDGKEITPTLLNGTSFSDSGLVNGTVYTYDVYTYDVSGNKSEKESITASPTASVVAAAAVIDVAPAISSINLPNEEIKAATVEKTENIEGDKKDVEVKDERKLPIWGILFLTILAGIGGYLFYSQRPENISKLGKNGK